MRRPFCFVVVYSRVQCSAETKSVVPFDVDPPTHDKSATEVVLPFHSRTDMLEN